MTQYESEKKARTTGDVKWPFAESNEPPGTGHVDEGAWTYANPVVRRPDSDRLDFKGPHAFVTLTTIDFSASVKATRVYLIRERAPTKEGKKTQFEFEKFDIKSIEDQKQTIRINLNDVPKVFFKYKRWSEKYKSTANSYFVVVYFFGASSYARAASPPFNILGRAAVKGLEDGAIGKGQNKRKPPPPDTPIYVDPVSEIEQKVKEMAVTELRLDMDPKQFSELVEARRGLTCSQWIELVKFIVSKEQLEDKSKSPAPLIVKGVYSHVLKDKDNYTSDLPTTHGFGLLRSFAVPKPEAERKSLVADDNLIVTARNLLVVLNFFRPFHSGKYTVAECLQHMTRNLADSEGRCAWWYHGIVSKDEVYRILYNDGKTTPVSRSFCVRFRETESQSMSIIHYRWEGGAPKWKERYIYRIKNGYQLQDLGYDNKPIEIIERPTISALVDELMNVESRRDRVLVMNQEVFSKFYREDMPPKKTNEPINLINLPLMSMLPMDMQLPTFLPQTPITGLDKMTDPVDWPGSIFVDNNENDFLIR